MHKHAIRVVNLFLVTIPLPPFLRERLGMTMEECKSDIPPYYVSYYFFVSLRYIAVRYRLRLSLSGSILYYIRLTALFTWNGACVVTFLMIMTNFAFLHDITFHILVLYYMYYIFSTYIYIVQFILLSCILDGQVFFRLKYLPSLL